MDSDLKYSVKAIVNDETYASWGVEHARIEEAVDSFARRVVYLLLIAASIGFVAFFHYLVRLPTLESLLLILIGVVVTLVASVVNLAWAVRKFKRRRDDLVADAYMNSLLRDSLEPESSLQGGEQ